MEYSIGKQRSPFGFQSHPKYSRNKHSFPKSVITAKFGSMTAFVFQLPIGWLNLVAMWNVPSSVVTDAVFQPLTGWLNSLAPLNMPCNVLTLAVFQSSSCWLNAAAPLNMSCRVVTLAVFQKLSSWLNSEAHLRHSPFYDK